MIFLLAFNLVIVLIFDMIKIYLTNEWTDVEILSIATVNVAFGIGAIFILLSPKGVNHDILTGSVSIISIVYLLVAIIVSVICTSANLELMLAIIIQAIVMILSVFIFTVNHVANTKTSEADIIRNEGMKGFFEADNILNEAMKRCNDPKLRKNIESAYDACMSRTKPGADTGVEYKIDQSAKIVRDAVINDDVDLVISECEKIVLLVDEREKLVRK